MENNFQNNISNELSVGDIIKIENISYNILGIISFKDADSTWKEYKLKSTSDSSEYWLSIDDNKDASLFTMLSQKPSNFDLYQQTENGIQNVVYSEGDVDVEDGESAGYQEYVYNNSILAVETWDDEIEYSIGKKIDYNSIKIFVKNNEQPNFKSNLTSSTPKEKSNKGCLIITIVAVIIGIIYFATRKDANPIVEYFEKTNSQISLKTSITTPDKNSASIYQLSISEIEPFVKSLIDNLDGEVLNSIEATNTAEAVALNSSNDFCLIYKSTDNEYLAHVCSRKYLYDNLNEPLYHADDSTESFYRGYYTNLLFSEDNYSYKNTHTYYHSYFIYSTNDRYNTYCNSVRQASIARRSSNGGGHGGGGK
ncbi:MAG: DUF4178 domain-containing protein [Bacteroidales bacterium]|nr:DUF4178 domain-containing protein [Bacteroidales bacterium]